MDDGFLLVHLILLYRTPLLKTWSYAFSDQIYKFLEFLDHVVVGVVNLCNNLDFQINNFKNVQIFFIQISQEKLLLFVFST